MPYRLCSLVDSTPWRMTSSTMLRRMGHRGWFPQSIRGSACLQKPIGDAKVHYWWVGMMRDITKGCIVCVTRSVGRAVKPPPPPPPPPDSHSCGRPIRPGRRGCAPVPQDQPQQPLCSYLYGLPDEVFAVPDQTAATIARLLVEEIVSRHGVPSEVLSDRGRAFLSGLMQREYYRLSLTAWSSATIGRSLPC